MPSLLWISCFMFAVSILIYFGELLIRYYLYAMEYIAMRRAPKLSWTHDDMVRVAQEKKDEEMTDEDIRIKYGYTAHECWRVALLSRKQYDFLDRLFFHYETRLRWGGVDKLHRAHPIIKPIFIIGDFRSGTSVLERIIHHHPAVVAYDMTNMVAWRAPRIWDAVGKYIERIRRDMGSTSWVEPGGLGVYYQHSSGKLLTRDTPYEVELLWAACKRNMLTNRYSKKTQPDIPDADLLDENFSDPEFEEVLKASISLVLEMKQGRRFIQKNPLNGFRVGYLSRIFPDAKFIFISRDPRKTLRSQVTMHRAVEKSYGVDDRDFRTSNFAPTIPSDVPAEHWSVFSRGQYLNELFRQLWFPRVFPRFRNVEQIDEDMVKGRIDVAFARGMRQHEEAVTEAFERIGAREGDNLLTVFHEDLIDRPKAFMRIVFDYLELETSDEQLLDFLEKEDFPGGRVSKKRRTKSTAVCRLTDETSQVEIVLAPLMKRFERDSGTIFNRYGVFD